MAGASQVEFHALRFLIPGLILGILLLFFFVDPQEVAGVYWEEARMHERWLGPETEGEIRTSAAAFTSNLLGAESARTLLDTGNEYVRSNEITDPLAPLAGKATSYLKARIDTLEAALYIVTYRVFTVLAWYPAMMAIYMMVLFDSYLMRARSMWQFSFKSPIAHRMMTSMFMFSVIYLLMVHPFLPFAISPFYAPLVIVLQAFSLWGWITYTQKRL